MEAADYERRGLRGAGADGAEGGLNLDGELAGRQNDERLGALDIELVELLDDGDEEAEGLASAGCRCGQNITAFEGGRYCAGLDGRWGDELVGIETRHERRGDCKL
jgi:hypothetical protein